MTETESLHPGEDDIDKHLESEDDAESIISQSGSSYTPTDESSSEDEFPTEEAEIPHENLASSM